MPIINLTPISKWRANVQTTPRPPDIIEDILSDTSEVSAIVGRSGIGKTNLCNQLMHGLANGTEFIGHKIPKPVKVAYIGFENEAHMFNERCNKLEVKIPASPNLFISTPAPMFKLNQNTQVEFLQQIDGFKVIIIDPVRYIVPGDYMDPKVITEFMTLLQDCMQINNSVAIVVLYFKKLDSRFPLEPGDLWNIKGGTEWGDMASTVMMLERAKQGHKPTGGFAPLNKDEADLYFAKTRNAANIHDPVKLRFNRKFCLFEVIKSKTP